MGDVLGGQDGITQRRRGPVKVVYSGYLSSRPTSGGLYIHDSEHPHLCTDVLNKQRVEAGYIRKE